MKAFVQQITKGLVNNGSAFSAGEGLKQMGWEVEYFSAYADIKDRDLDPEVMVVGGIGEVRQRLQDLGCVIPDEINYPESLRKYLGRKMWTTTINQIANDPSQWNVFVKPMFHSKKFVGVVVRSVGDLVGCGDQELDTPVICSEVVDFVAEWRCYVRYGEILDARMYKGDWRACIGYKTIEEAVRDYTDAPAAYGIDFGLTADGRMLLVEVNDGHSLGNYGLTPLRYAKLLSARWAQMTGTTDYCNF